MTDALVVRNQAPSLMRRVWNTIRRSAGPSLDDFGPFKTDAGWSISMGQSPTTYERVGRNIRLKGFEENPVVSACIRTVADLVGPVRLELCREAADGEMTLEANNPGQQILDRPRVGWSSNRMRQMKAAHILSYGNAYQQIVRQGKFGMPIGLRMIHPERVVYVYLDAETLDPIRYDWTDLRGVRHESPWQDIIHYRDLTLDPDGLFGFPRGAAALLDIVTDGEASQYVRQILSNNGAPGLIIRMKQIVTERDAKSADERWHEKMIERGERGRTRFLPGVEGIDQIGFDLKELEFPNLRGIAREDICAVFGVDPRMIGVASAKGSEAGLSGQQYQEARRRLYLQTGAPLMTTIESELDLSYCPEFGDRLRARFSPDAISEITEDEEQTSLRVTRHWQAGLISREEGRRKISMPEKMKPSEFITVPRGTSVFTVQDAALAAAAAADRIVNPPAPSAPPGTAAPGAPAAGSGAPPAGSQRSRLLIRGQRATALTADQRRALWQLFDQRATTHENAYRRAARLQFTVERTGVADAFHRAANQGRRAVPVPAGADDPYLAAAEQLLRALYRIDGEFHQAWIDRYHALISETFRLAGEDIAGGLGVSFTLENPRVQQAINDRVRRLADLVTDTTAQKITEAIAAGHEAGLGITEIADLVDESVFANQAPARSLTIARTESAAALNQGEYVSAVATGVIRSKQWLSMRDDAVRDSHANCEDEGWIELDGAFSNGLMFPGDPSGDAEDVINCRCALLYSDEEPQ